MVVPMKSAITSDSMGGSLPASNSNTFQFGFSLRRLATAQPKNEQKPFLANKI